MDVQGGWTIKYDYVARNISHFNNMIFGWWFLFVWINNNNNNSPTKKTASNRDVKMMVVVIFYDSTHLCTTRS